MTDPEEPAPTPAGPAAVAGTTPPTAPPTAPPAAAPSTAPSTAAPATPADSRRPPRWLPRALVMAVVAVFAGILVWRAASMLGNVFTILVVSWFLALAMEPMILWLGRRGVKRPLATGITMLGSLVVGIGVLALLGGLFVNQLVALVRSIPGYYADLREFLDDRFEVTLPRTDELLTNAGDYVDDIAPGVIGVGTSIAGGLFTATAVLLVVYYMASAGPRFRASVCRYLAPDRQREVLRLWEVSQDKVAGFITSRIALAAISTAATWVFLAVLGVPYALPLATFTGLVSQFVPTVGTYIGGALPVLVALSVSPVRSLAVLAFIIAYQQVENLFLTPKVSQRSLALNPAVAFLSVIAFGAVFGPLGAFLSLPVVATVQAVASTYVRRHELVDSALLQDEQPGRRRDPGTDLRPPVAPPADAS
ncbi:AI-2E family transporter [Cellulomonas sp. C5510]|uniref:AI-2E family transporter n=1 Tax=Cellulomonas sp. C5510 TaxID=2871170 RepID=UPI001C982D47|nr:AI-2E family transporter [Cellulomonas sp. C5510]QZN86964.1 AI-2E family transporter [Cellulomonas sp. C5510]